MTRASSTPPSPGTQSSTSSSSSGLTGDLPSTCTCRTRLAPWRVGGHADRISQTQLRFSRPTSCARFGSQLVGVDLVGDLGGHRGSLEPQARRHRDLQAEEPQAAEEAGGEAGSPRASSSRRSAASPPRRRSRGGAPGGPTSPRRRGGGSAGPASRRRRAPRMLSMLRSSRGTGGLLIVHLLPEKVVQRLSRARARRRHRLRVGLYFPFSINPIVWRVAWTASASSCWESPFSVRATLSSCSPSSYLECNV